MDKVIVRECKPLWPGINRIRINDIKIKPYVRMTQRGKYVKKDAQEYLVSKHNLELQFITFMGRNKLSMAPEKTPLKIQMNIWAPKSQGHRADTDNIIKAILDAGNGILYPDDRWVDAVWADRYFSPDHPMLLLALYTVHDQYMTPDELDKRLNGI